MIPSKKEIKDRSTNYFKQKLVHKMNVASNDGHTEVVIKKELAEPFINELKKLGYKIDTDKYLGYVISWRD